MKLGVWMMSCPEVRGWEFWWFWKKQLVEICHWARLVKIQTWARPVEIWTWVRAVQLGPTGCAARLLGQIEWFSIVKIVSLSPCVKKTKSQKKVNKRFVPVTKESRQCFGISMHLNILRICIMPYVHITILTLCKLQKTKTDPLTFQEEQEKIKGKYPRHSHIFMDGFKQEKTIGCTAVYNGKMIKKNISQTIPPYSMRKHAQ